MKCTLLWVFISVIIRVNQAAEILFLFPFSSPSHVIPAYSLVDGLAAKGHKITFVSPFSRKENKSELIREVVLNKKVRWNLQAQTLPNESKTTNFRVSPAILDLAANITQEILNLNNYWSVFQDEKKYDVAVVSTIFNEFNLVPLYYKRIPFVYFSPSKLMTSIAWSSNIPTPFSYVPFTVSASPTRMNFFRRFLNALGHVYFRLVLHYKRLIDMDDIIEKYYKTRPPSLVELEESVSLVLINTHFAVDYPRPLMPHAVEIGGIHCRKPKKLPPSIEMFLSDTTDNGFILFSLGSILTETQFPESVLKSFIKVFSKIKQKIIWKIDEDIPNLPTNILASKWIPQQDLLGHPNCKIFITHGGQLSLLEAAYHGVPVIGIPFWLDQATNVAIAEENGFAVELPVKNINEKSLLTSISLLLEDPRFRSTVKNISAIMNDNPLDPLDTSVFWIEYVIRHKGAAQLHSKAKNLHWFQYLLLDVITVIVIACLILKWFLFRLKYLLWRTCNLCKITKEKIF